MWLVRGRYGTERERRGWGLVAAVVQPTEDACCWTTKLRVAVDRQRPWRAMIVVGYTGCRVVDRGRRVAAGVAACSETTIERYRYDARVETTTRQRMLGHDSTKRCCAAPVAVIGPHTATKGALKQHCEQRPKERARGEENGTGSTVTGECENGFDGLWQDCTTATID